MVQSATIERAEGSVQVSRVVAAPVLHAFQQTVVAFGKEVIALVPCHLACLSNVGKGESRMDIVAPHLAHLPVGLDAAAVHTVPVFGGKHQSIPLFVEVLIVEQHARRQHGQCGRSIPTGMRGADGAKLPVGRHQHITHLIEEALAVFLLPSAIERAITVAKHFRRQHHTLAGVLKQFCIGRFECLSPFCQNACCATGIRFFPRHVPLDGIVEGRLGIGRSSLPLSVASAYFGRGLGRVVAFGQWVGLKCFPPRSPRFVAKCHVMANPFQIVIRQDSARMVERSLLLHCRFCGNPLDRRCPAKQQRTYSPCKHQGRELLFCK